MGKKGKGKKGRRGDDSSDDDEGGGGGGGGAAAAAKGSGAGGAAAEEPKLARGAPKTKLAKKGKVGGAKAKGDDNYDINTENSGRLNMTR